MTEAVLDERMVGEPNPPEELRSRLLSRGDKLQMLPAVAMKALSMAKDPDCSISEFASVVERDVRLASDILRIANSAFYATRHPIISLQQAVVRLGFAHCRNLIVAAGLGSLMRKMNLSEAWMQEVLWRHAILTGMLSVHLNRRLQLGFTGEEFAGGMIHDVGRSLFGVVAPNHFMAADPLDFDESMDPRERERSILRSDHSELGAWFMAKNQLPTTLIEVIRFHHAPDQATENPRLVALTAVADDMANHMLRSDVVEEYDPATNHMIGHLAPPDSPLYSKYMDAAHAVMNDVVKESRSPNQPFGLA